MTPITALVEKLKSQLDEWDLWDSDPTEAFERIAAKFYAETGFLAPGKSEPLEMANIEHEKERNRRYAEWTHARRRERRQMLRACAEVLAALPAAGQSPEVPPLDKEHKVQLNHPTRPVWVSVAIDVGIADLVERLQTYPGVWTFASCQGGKSYAPYVMVGWDNAETLVRLQSDFTVDVLGDSLGYVRTMSAPASQQETPQPEQEKVTRDSQCRHFVRTRYLTGTLENPVEQFRCDACGFDSIAGQPDTPHEQTKEPR